MMNSCKCPPCHPMAQSKVTCNLRKVRLAGTRIVRWISGTLSRSSMRKTRARSEEHTSELQSLMRFSYAAFCLRKQLQIVLLKLQLLTHLAIPVHTKYHVAHHK